MTTQVAQVPASATIHEVMEKMVTEDVGRVLVTDNGVPVGIFTERHVLTRVANGKLDPKKTSVAGVMTAPIRGVSEETGIVDALAEMFRGQIRHLQVSGEGGSIIGIVSMRRILALAVELGEGMNETKTVGSIMSRRALSIDESASVADAIELMIESRSPAVVVMSASKPAGIFTERDVLTRVVTKELDSRTTAIKDVMTSPPATMPENALIGEVLAQMYQRDIRNMPIINEQGELTGLVAMPDVLQYARAFDIDETVRKTWKDIQRFHDSEDQYTPG